MARSARFLNVMQIFSLYRYTGKKLRNDSVHGRAVEIWYLPLFRPMSLSVVGGKSMQQAFWRRQAARIVAP